MFDDLFQRGRFAEHHLVHRTKITRSGLPSQAADADGRGGIGGTQGAADRVADDDRKVARGVQRAGDQRRWRDARHGVPAQHQEFARHLGAGCIGIALEAARIERARQHGQAHEALPDRPAELEHNHRMLKLLDAVAELDQPGADRGIGDAFEIARNQLVGNAEAGGDGADVVLDEGTVIARIGRFKELNIGAWRQRDQAAWLHADLQHAARGRSVVQARDRSVGIADEPGEQGRDLGLHQRRILVLIEFVQPEQDRREPGDAAQLPGGERLEQMRDVSGGHPDRIERNRRQRVARPTRVGVVGDPPPAHVELDAGPHAPAVADLAMEISRHLFAVEKIDRQGWEAGTSINGAQPGEALTTFYHRSKRQRLKPVEVGDARSIRTVGPTPPQIMQPIPHRRIGMQRTRLNPGTDRVRHEALHGGSDPGVVAGIRVVQLPQEEAPTDQLATPPMDGRARLETS